MAKSNNQKTKILYLEKMLRDSGEDRVITMQEILNTLMEKGISAERKSIYDDIEALRSFGMDIQFRRGRPGGYYIKGQAGIPAQEQEEIPVDAPAQKRESEDTAAEDTGKEISLQELPVEKKDGKDALNADSASEAHVWKFAAPAASDGKREMKLLCANKRRGDVCAYFGSGVQYKDKGQGYFSAAVPMTESSDFYGWLTAMGKDIRILKPKKAAQAYREYLKILVKEYKGI